MPEVRPHGRRAALCLSFDNLGEAAELELGRWPRERPLGRHSSVTVGLPAVLARLRDLRATFFVEGWNAERYPDALRRIADAGHELALHGWRHEAWRGLDAETERAVLARSVEALSRLGIEPAGFRPPGGALAPGSLACLASLGLDYCSPHGRRARVEHGIAVLPFAWPAVDAYYAEPLLAPVREARGDGAAPLPPERWLAGVDAVLDACEREGGFRCLVLHPYLLVAPEWREVFDSLLERVRARHLLETTTFRGASAWLRGGSGRRAASP
jgi:peptidoglycan/xylan/chitin deacetylase (PgdA/CDA1 family)